jgi:LPXTG-site transpeptidase (sortase) family protein
MLKLAFATAAALMLVAVAAGTMLATQESASALLPLTPGPEIGTSASSSPSPTGSTLTTREVKTTTPVRLAIPSIHLDATVEARGLDANRNLDTASSPNDVAWYDMGPVPGQPGNAIINGHVDWWTGDAVFTRLGRVRPGDLVEVIRADGGVVTFRITRLQRVPANARIASLFAPSPDATLTLITCAGVWNPLALTNTERLLVQASVVV